mgnify:CR=1 FL=1
MNIEQIGYMFKQRREFLQIRQEDLAEMSGVNTRTINQVENGKGNPAIGTLEKLALVLGLEILVQVKVVN